MHASGRFAVRRAWYHRPETSTAFNKDPSLAQGRVSFLRPSSRGLAIRLAAPLTDGQLHQRILSGLPDLIQRRFPKISFSFAHGSGVVPRGAASSPASTEVIDLTFSVPNLQEFWEENKLRNPKDKMFGICTVNLMEGMNRYLDLDYNCSIRYRAFEDEDFLEDLTSWTRLEAAMALHLPIQLMTMDSKNEEYGARLLSGLQKNREMALAAALLILGRQPESDWLNNRRELPGSAPPLTGIGMKGPEEFYSAQAELRRLLFEAGSYDARFQQAYYHAMAAEPDPALRAAKGVEALRPLVSGTGASAESVASTIERKEWEIDLFSTIAGLGKSIQGTSARSELDRIVRNPINNAELCRMYLLEEEINRNVYTETPMELWERLPPSIRDQDNGAVPEVQDLGAATADRIRRAAANSMEPLLFKNSLAYTWKSWRMRYL